MIYEEDRIEVYQNTQNTILCLRFLDNKCVGEDIFNYYNVFSLRQCFRIYSENHYNYDFYFFTKGFVKYYTLAHTCPFSVEIHDDYSLCRCNAANTTTCAEDV